VFNAYVLVRNLDSGANQLDFGDFTLRPVGARFQELRDVFSSKDVNRDDWIFEKSYTVPPPGPPGSPVGGIPQDLEDLLLLFRLYKPGDLAFVRQAITPPGAGTVVQFPYRAMNDLNSYSVLRYQFVIDECDPWKRFANGMKTSQSWNADWFTVARRLFLHGGAKEFNPKWDDVDRIVDYVTALEAAVVPEMDFARKRISCRCAKLITTDPARQAAIASLVKRLYDARSSVVHGSKLSNDKRDWLIENCGQVEVVVREALVAALQRVPADEAARKTLLADLCDPTDEDRGAFALQKFQEIRTDIVRNDIAEKIARVQRGNNP
jgi:hypothetical protein